MKSALSASLLCLTVILAAFNCCASVLTIENRTGQEIINILVSSRWPAREFFMRLDLLPGASDSVENPACSAALRVDTGLSHLNFADINLGQASRLIFSGNNCLVINEHGKEIGRYAAQVENLAPEPGDKPVCSLGQFRPAMTMREVCEILPGDMLRDDNGALLAGLGFAGMTWAARLVPDATQPVTADSLLDHLALRRPLSLPDLSALLRFLLKQGYVPWQADFPGIDLNLVGEPATRSDAEVMDLAQSFIAAAKSNAHGDHAKGDRCAEASIIMAPGARLHELENTDQPAEDVQIYTLYLQPCTNTLLLDLAAYRKAG